MILLILNKQVHLQFNPFFPFINPLNAILLNANFTMFREKSYTTRLRKKLAPRNNCFCASTIHFFFRLFLEIFVKPFFRGLLPFLQQFELTIIVAVQNLKFFEGKYHQMTVTFLAVSLSTPSFLRRLFSLSCVLSTSDSRAIDNIRFCSLLSCLLNSLSFLSTISCNILAKSLRSTSFTYRYKIIALKVVIKRN